MNQRRVVITGAGLVTSVGNSVNQAWASLLAGKSGIRRITKFDATGFGSQIAGDVRDLDITTILSVKEARRLDPYCHYSIAAAEEAVTHANLKFEATDRSRTGVLVGSGIGGIITLEQQVAKLITEGPSRVSPFVVPMMIGDMASGVISIRYHVTGPNFGLASACSTGTHAIGESYWIIKRDEADIMITGGADACVNPISVAGFASMKALSTRNDDPEHASRPFDAQRDGFVLSEGAGVVILEALDHALRRNAPILAEVIGYAATADAYHITSPDPENRGAVTAIQLAMKRAGIDGGDVEYINAHGTGTEKNDVNETQAIKKVFGQRAYDIPISSTKSLTGHALGAAGAIESVFCAKAIHDGCIPGTYNYEFPDPLCDLHYVPNQCLARAVRIALNLNFGFGGHNAVLVLRQFEQ